VEYGKLRAAKPESFAVKQRKVQSTFIFRIERELGWARAEMKVTAGSGRQ
jgi:hypothetical protein